MAMNIYDNSPPNGDYIREIERLEALQRIAHQADVQRDVDRASNLASTRKDGLKVNSISNNDAGQTRKEKRSSSPSTTSTAAASGANAQAWAQSQAAGGKEGLPDLTVLLKSLPVWIVGALVAAGLLTALTSLPFFASLIVFGMAAMQGYRHFK